MATYFKQVHMISNSGTENEIAYNADLVSSLAEASTLHLCYYDQEEGTFYTSLGELEHGNATAGRVWFGDTYAILRRSGIPYTVEYFTSNGTFIVPSGVVKLRITLIGGGGGAINANVGQGSYSGGSGGSTTATLWQLSLSAGGGGGGYCYQSYWTSENGEDSGIDYYWGAGSGGSPNGHSGSGSTGGGYGYGGAGFELGDGNIYGKGADSTQSYYVGYSWGGWGAPRYSCAMGGGSGGYHQSTIGVYPGETITFTIGQGASGAQPGAAKVEYGEGIE